MAKLILMVSRLWWLRRACVALLLIASLGASVVALPHVERDADDACTAIAAAHDQSAHYVGPDATPEPADAHHCFLCHSLRSFHPGLDKYEHHHDTPRTERLHVTLIDGASAVAWARVPGRAPPL